MTVSRGRVDGGPSGNNIPLVPLSQAKFKRLAAVVLAFAPFLLIAALVDRTGRKAPAGVRAVSAIETHSVSTASFDRLALVFLHARCLNCHQSEVPLRGETGVPHYPPVARGRWDEGTPALPCESCHRETNSAHTRVPGAPHWKLAPRSTAWDDLEPAGICKSIKDPAFNGGRDIDELIHHLETDKLVQWSWEPGRGREPVSAMSYVEFIKLFRAWAKVGAPCPEG